VSNGGSGKQGDTGSERGLLELRTRLGGLIVLAGLGAMIAAVALILHHYPVVSAGKTTPGEDRSSSVVAVLAPIVAGIASIVGLYFGVSATGSARGQEAQVRGQEAQTASETTKTVAAAGESVANATQMTAENAASVAQAASSITATVKTATEAAQSATEAAKSAIAVASQVVETAGDGPSGPKGGTDPTAAKPPDPAAPKPPGGNT
jgi:hypothetical protein